MITADGLRGDSLGCAGNPDVRTPNIDALASHGLQFTHAFTACAHAPSGGHPFLTGAVPPTMDPEGPPICPDVELLWLPAILRAAGYTTAAVGALDLPGERVEGVFDHVQAMGCEGLADGYVDWLRTEGQVSNEDEDAAASALLQEPFHPTTWAGNEAVRLARSVPEPFFLWASFPRPRPPLDPPVPWKHMYRPSRLTLPSGSALCASDVDRAYAVSRDLEGRSESDYRRILTAWYGSISHVDRQIGRLLATLTSRGRTNNLFVITAGRGAYMGYHGLLHTEPGPLYEPLVRVPLIIGGIPGQRRGATEPALVSTGDVVPTLLEVVHGGVPALPGGRSLLPQLREDGLPHRRTVSFYGGESSGLRSTRYKWLAGGSRGVESLFDLQADPLERHNLHGERQSLAIRKMLLASPGSGAVEPQR
jgi:arylsulfatase A-like enzyme